MNMNQLIPITEQEFNDKANKFVHLYNGEPRTNSLIIAECTDNQHASIIKLIKNDASRLRKYGFLDLKSEKSGGRPKEYFMLNEHQATLIITYLKNTDAVKDFKDALVAEFMHLRSAKESFDPANISKIDILRLAMESEQEKLELKHQIEESAPKIEFYDSHVKNNGLYNLQMAGRTITGKPNKFIGWLKQDYLFYQNKDLIPRQKYIQQGLFEVKVTTVNDHERVQTYVTPKGMRHLAEKCSLVAA